ncbi:hypothetical protein [Desulfitobacterium sp. PCE1]|uniref:hypothetical protein n=1 Tax=Desulfitobacterium sp. PCE1 TaxID=146907 RepID=UPI00036DF351|nr:hypothetical protein [Desulfitobacterium sp. PCE1]
MITKIQYTDQINRQEILDANKDKILIEEQNIVEGNFLVFSDTPNIEDITEETLLETKYQTALLELML